MAKGNPDPRDAIAADEYKAKHERRVGDDAREFLGKYEELLDEENENEGRHRRR